MSLLHRSPFLYGFAKRTAGLQGFLPPKKIEGIPGRVHRNDLMSLDMDSYKESSGVHFEALERELRKGGKTWSSIDHFIDFGCGYGRVTRWLPSVLNAKQITACDVNSEAVEWCKKEFEVFGLITRSDFSETPFGSYDALFACSVLTHLSPKRICSFLDLLPNILNEGAVAVLTGKSKSSAENATEINAHLSVETIIEAIEEKGVFFKAYPHYRDPDLGDTYFSREWFEKLLPKQLKLVAYSPGTFWSHDSYVLRCQTAA